MNNFLPFSVHVHVIRQHTFSLPEVLYVADCQLRILSDSCLMKKMSKFECENSEHFIRIHH